MNLSIGMMVGFYSRLYAKSSAGNFGYDVDLSKKWELLRWGLSSIGCFGIITEPAQTIGGKDIPLDNVKVTLHKKDSTESDREIYSDTSGKYSFKNLSKGTYTLTFEKDGYVKKEEKRFEISDLDEEKDVSLSLKKFGMLRGRLVNAGDNQPIAGVGLTLVKVSDPSIVIYATSDADGFYQFGEKDNEKTGITPGVYSLTIKKNGYREVKQKVAVTVNDAGEIYIDNINMVEGAYGDCKVSGYIYDIATGRSTGAELQLTLRGGINDVSATILDGQSIGPDGAYSFDVQAGNYTIMVEDLREGIDDDQRYHTTSFNVVAVNGKTMQQNGYVSQSASEDQIRIVLTWGETPRDLDSHLLGPTGDGSNRFHTYYGNKVYRYNGRIYADLDLDDTSSYGPETTTIYYGNGSGIYSYYVHDFTNRESGNSQKLALSQATVKVYKGSTLAAVYRVPSGVGTAWHVFDYDAGTEAFIPVNSMSNQSDPGQVGTRAVKGDMTAEQQDLQTIFHNLPEKQQDAEVF